MSRTRALGEAELIDRPPCIVEVLLRNQLLLCLSKYLFLATICSMELAQFCYQLLRFLLCNPHFLSCTSSIKKKKSCFIKYIQLLVKGTLNSKVNISFNSKDIISHNSKCSEFKKKNSRVDPVKSNQGFDLPHGDSNNLLIPGLSLLQSH